MREGSFHAGSFRRLLAPFALLTCACASAPHETGEMPATREDVAVALRAQFELVLARSDALADETGPEAEREREEMRRLAVQIAGRLVRVDPDSRARVLAARLESMR